VWAQHGLALLVVLAAVAVLAPPPGSTDRGFYEQLGRELIVRDCADIHCFRPLVPGILEQLPGPSAFKWKAYAVIANAVAALAVGRFSLLIGLSAPAALAATWLAALGTGSLYSLFDPHTADPLMYMLGPLLAIQLWRGQIGRAGWLSAVGVFAKEFAAAPLWIFTGSAVLMRRWPAAGRLLLVSAAVMLVWLAKQTGLMVLLNYRFGFTASDDLLHGGYIATWLSRVGWSGALMYLFTAFGALYLLLPAGFLRAGREVRMLALATAPAAAAFLYVEQPERAFWNFHFVVIPLAVLALEALPAWAMAFFVAASGIVGLRFGAQFEIRSIARAALIVALVIAGAAIVETLRRLRTAGLKPCATPDTEHPAHSPQYVAQGFSPAVRPVRFWSVLGLELAALALLTVVLLDVHAHRLEETNSGVNQRGFRGPLRTTKPPGPRIAVVGGSAAFESGTPWWNTMAAQMEDALNEHDSRRQTWVDNLSEPGAGAREYVAVLRDYAYLQPDVVCIFDGYDAVDETGPSHGRRGSFVFRLTGHLPGALAPADREPAPVLRDAPFDPVLDPSCSGASASYCLAMIDTVRFALDQKRAVLVATPPYVSPRHEIQQQSLAEHLARQFGNEPRFKYVNLGRTADRPALVSQLAGEILAILSKR
jgi:hypothetical protein